MSKDQPPVQLDTLVALAKRRGFIFPGSDVYGGLAGTWDYGPMGVQLKRNIMQLWWKMFVDDRDDMFGVDAAILMNQKVWQASGHVDTFTDPMVECSNCQSRFRADKIDVSKCPTCGKEGTFGEPRQFNMMFKTQIGPTWMGWEADDGNYLTGKLQPVSDKGTNLDSFSIPEERKLTGIIAYDKKSQSYLRPETAQGIFTNFKNVVDTQSPNLPFGIAQQGKAFRNEISPRDFIFRAREFEQMEIEYFVDPAKWEEAFEMWVKLVHDWCDALGLPKTSVHELEVEAKDRAHYSKRTIDFEFDFPIGKEELLGLAYRTDFDLGNIERESGKSMKYIPKEDGAKPFIPHVIEPSFGVERAVMAVLSSAYYEEEVSEGDTRVVLRLKPALAPVKIAVSPLLRNKPELVELSQKVYRQLKKQFGAVMYDDNGNIGKRYRRQDEIGTPLCIVVDFDSLEGSDVTIRHRDTMAQTRVKIDELDDVIARQLASF